MKILVIFTGGTIGSSVAGDYISLDESKKYKLIDMYTKAYGDDADFDTINPYTVLSENITFKTYDMLREAIAPRLEKDYDGIIVTHGSDTLQYSACAMQLFFGNATIPIMFVASNYVLEDQRANGLTNFADAVAFIKNNCGSGVFIAYDGFFHRPVYALNHMAYDDKLVSIGGMFYGRMMDGEFVPNCDYAEYPVDKADDLVDNLEDESNVWWIKMCPGISFGLIPSNVKKILLEGYHSGTLCVASGEIKRLCAEAKDKGISIWLTGANSEMDYDSCSEYEKLGIRRLPRVSPVFSYMELSLKR